MKNPAALTLTEFAAIDARGARTHYKRAVLERIGDVYRMYGPSGVHTLQRVATDLDRLNAHWVNFAEHPANDYVRA